MPPKYKTKNEVIKKILKHFKKNNNNYFIEKILNITNYEEILNCLKAKQLNDLIEILKEDLSKSPIENNNGAAINNTPQKKTLNKQNNSLLTITNNFNSKRDSNISIDFDEINSKKKQKKQEKIMELAKLFKDEIIKIKFTNVKGLHNLEIKIIDELSIRDDTLLYIGEILTDFIDTRTNKTIKDIKVVVKVQPRIPSKIKLDFPFQVTTEYGTMVLLERNCKEVPSPKLYGYECIKQLTEDTETTKKNESDIERYILVSELLGKDLAKSLKNKDINDIKKYVIMALRAVQKLHKCNYIHLDIKHENLVFSDSTEKEIKIIDFGMAEYIYNRHNQRNLELRKPNEGSPLYMSTMQHTSSIKDFMDDIQAFGWMLLDLLSDNEIGYSMPWNGLPIQKIFQMKQEFIKNYENDSYISNIINGKLNKNNLKIIGKIVKYTLNEKLKLSHTIKNKEYYYTEYNDKYYDDIILLINKLN